MNAGAYIHFSQLSLPNAIRLVAKVNQKLLRGFGDWVLPTVDQLQLLRIGQPFDEPLVAWTSEKAIYHKDLRSRLLVGPVRQQFRCVAMELESGNCVQFADSKLLSVVLVRHGELQMIGDLAIQRICELGN